jgi:hypothetical protein
MPSPDAPGCFAIRRLNPFLGVVQVLDIGIGHPISVDSVSWQIQIRVKTTRQQAEPCGGEVHY